MIEYKEIFLRSFIHKSFATTCYLLYNLMLLYFHSGMIFCSGAIEDYCRPAYFCTVIYLSQGYIVYSKNLNNHWLLKMCNIISQACARMLSFCVLYHLDPKCIMLHYNHFSLESLKVYK